MSNYFRRVKSYYLIFHFKVVKMVQNINPHDFRRQASIAAFFALMLLSICGFSQTMPRPDKIFIQKGIQFQSWIRVDHASEDIPAPVITSVSIGRNGRYVRVQLSATDPLSLAEVQVFSGGINVARNKNTQQSTNNNPSTGLSNLAVDGNTDGNWTNGSVTQTLDGRAEMEPWWQVDLGGVVAIDSIRIWNRTDCCDQRLKGFYLFVSDNPYNTNTLVGTLAQTGVTRFVQPGIDHYPFGTELTNIGFTPTYYERPLYNYTIHQQNPNSQWSLAKGMDATANYRSPSAFEQSNGFLNSLQLADLSKLSSICFGDEEGYSSWQASNMRSWFDVSKAKYPDVLVHNNQWWHWNFADVASYMQIALPDLITFDRYYFKEGIIGAGNSYMIIMQDLQEYRQLALKGNDGTGTAPIAFGAYLQGDMGWHSGGWNYYPSESEFNIGAFAYLTMGAKWLNVFRYITGRDGYFFKDADGRLLPQYYQYANIGKQLANLSPHLSRLRTTDVRFIPGRNTGGANASPNNIATWSPNADSYVKNIVATNLVNNTNNGLPGDILIGYFKPVSGINNTAGINMAPVLSENTNYFMVLNGLTKSNGCCSPLGSPQLRLDTIQGHADQARQRITFTVDFGTAPLATLHRVRRSDGVAEMVNLTSIGGTRYEFSIILDGGLADLFYWKESNPSLAVTPSIISPTGTLTVNFANGPGNTTDWIGIYKSTDVPGSAPATAWAYVSGSNGSLNFSTSGGFPTGQYYAAFFSANTFNEIASRVAFTVANGPAITVTPQTIAPNGTVTVNFANGPGNSTDWIGIYKSADVPGSSPATAWAYVTGSNGSLNFSKSGGLATGQYYAAFFSNNNYNEIASRASFTVIASFAVNSSARVPVPATMDQTDEPFTASVKVYPNPVTDGLLHVEIQTQDTDLISIGVFDLIGRSIYHPLRRLEKGMNKIDLDISELPAGYYILKIRNNHSLNEFKIVKAPTY
jgi:hypothetical protein